MALALLPGAPARAGTAALPSRVAPRGGPHDAPLSGLDGRVRHRQPDRALRRDRARRGHEGRAVHLHGRVHVLPAPARPVRGVAHDHVRARARDARPRAAISLSMRAQLSRGLRLTTIVIVPAAALYIALGAPDHRDAACNAARSPPATRRLWPTRSSPSRSGSCRSRSTCSRCARSPRGSTPFTPFWINCIENAVNIALAFGLYAWLGVPGLALAFSIAYFVGAVVALGGRRPAARRHRRPRARDHARRSASSPGAAVAVVAG